MAPCDDSVAVIRLLHAASNASIDIATARLGVGGDNGPTIFTESCGRGNATVARWLATQPRVAAAALAAEDSLLSLVAAQGHAEVVGVVLDLREFATSGACAPPSQGHSLVGVVLPVPP